jgi:uncharacterized repeat protein (TIGR03803 family)
MMMLAVFAVSLSFSEMSAGQGRERVLHSFGSNGDDGYQPEASLIFDAAGNLYGTTAMGGAHNAGTVFELMPAAGGGWTESVLFSFNVNDGQNPQAGLVFDVAGNLYGTTYRGGNDQNGTVFELIPESGAGWTQKVLHRFGSHAGDGTNPAGTLMIDAAGNLYGTTFNGGTGGGTVFKLEPNGSGWTEKVLLNFDSNGFNPAAGLISDAGGNLYGTTVNGGESGCGAVFELALKGGGWTEKILHTFRPGDGVNPQGGLISDAAGNLYGTTEYGGVDGAGTVFELAPKADGHWTEKILLSFDSHNFGGFNPVAGLILDASGNLYGTTVSGGAYYYGTVFELTPKAGGDWAEKVLQNFDDNDEGGFAPYSSLIFDAVGNLYGAATYGGNHGLLYGTVFEIKP